MKFRVYRVETDETIITIEAKDFFDASRIINKIFGTDNDSIDFEEV